MVENYPQLKANENVLALQEQLTTTENQISFSRQHYNATVNDYNTTIQTFPVVLIAGPLGFTQARVLRGRARGRPGPGRQRCADVRRGRAAPAPRRSDHGRPPSTARPRRTAATRSCSCWSSSPSWPSSGSRSATARPALAGGGLGLARHLRRHRDRRRRSARLLRRRPARPRRLARPRRSRPRAPQLYNVVRELTPRGGHADARASTSSTTRRPTRSRPAATRSTRPSRSRPASWSKLDREELQGVIGHELSHVRNYDIRYALLVGVLVGSIALAGRLLPADHVLGWAAARRPIVERPGRRRPAGDHPRHRHRPGRPGPLLRPLVQLAVSRQREYLADAVLGRADPQPARAGAGPGRDRRRPGGPGGRQPGDPAPLLREPDQEVRGRARRGSSRPTRRSSTGSTGSGT